MVKTGHLDRKLDQHQFLTNLPDQEAEPDWLRSFSDRLFADQLNGAVGDPVQFIQIMQPLRPLVVVEEFRATPPPRHRGAHIISCRAYPPHPRSPPRSP